MPKNIKNTIFNNSEELGFFIKNNRFAVRDLLEESPEFRQNLQYILEGEIIGNKVNTSTMVQLASNFDEEEKRNPLTNALIVGVAGQSFFSLCNNFLKEKIKNPFVKLDKEYIIAHKIAMEQEEEEELKKELVAKKEKIEEEKNKNDGLKKNIMMAMSIESMKFREQMNQFSLFASKNKEAINTIMSGLSQDVRENNEKLLVLILDKFNKSPDTSDYPLEIKKGVINAYLTATSVFERIIKDDSYSDEKIKGFLKEKNPMLYKFINSNFDGGIEGYINAVKNGDEKLNDFKLLSADEFFKLSGEEKRKLIDYSIKMTGELIKRGLIDDDSLRDIKNNEDALFELMENDSASYKEEYDSYNKEIENKYAVNNLDFSKINNNEKQEENTINNINETIIQQGNKI